MTRIMLLLAAAAMVLAACSNSTTSTPPAGGGTSSSVRPAGPRPSRSRTPPSTDRSSWIPKARRSTSSNRTRARRAPAPVPASRLAGAHGHRVADRRRRPEREPPRDRHAGRRVQPVTYNGHLLYLFSATRTPATSPVKASKASSSSHRQATRSSPMATSSSSSAYKY
jgi:hypothetical protein